MFFWNTCFFDDPVDVGSLISASSAFSQSSLNIWKFTVHVLVWRILSITLLACGASLVAQRLKRLPTRQETQVQSLGREDPLEKEMATHSSVLAWRIPGTGEPGGLPSMGSHRLGHD